MAREIKLPIKIGLSTLDTPMTKTQALRYGERHMPDDLKRAGFSVTVFESDDEIHGGKWYRVNYGKHVYGTRTNPAKRATVKRKPAIRGALRRKPQTARYSIDYMSTGGNWRRLVQGNSITALKTKVKELHRDLGGHYRIFDHGA